MHPSPTIRRIALVAATALVAGTAAMTSAAPAQAEDAFGNLAISGLPASITVPTASTDVPFTVAFSGPAVTADLTYKPYDQSYNGGTVTLAASNGVTSPVSLYVNEPTSLTPGTANAFSITISPYATPGHYVLSVPVTQTAYGTTTTKAYLATSVQFDLVANPAVTLSQSYLTGGGKFSKKAKWSWSYTGPEYVKGATIKVYYQASGKKKYTVVASAKLNATGDAAFKGKKGAIRKKGKAYYVITSVAYSPLTTSSLYSIKKV